MMRAILIGVVISAASASLGCGSTGDGTPKRLPDPSGPQDPAGNPDDPAANPDDPNRNPADPARNPDQPARNPDAPRAPSPTLGNGGDANHPPPPGSGSCTEVCATLAGCTEACTRFCNEVPNSCAPLATSVRTCAILAGITCNNGNINITGGGCSAEQGAYAACAKAAAKGM